MININVINETAQLKSVIVGIADDFGGVPDLENCYDPKSKEHVLAGTFSKNKDCIEEIEGLVSLFEKYNIKVYRPSNIINLNQIFARDIAFVIKDKLACIALSVSVSTELVASSKTMTGEFLSTARAILSL